MSSRVWFILLALIASACASSSALPDTNEATSSEAAAPSNETGIDADSSEASEEAQSKGTQSREGQPEDAPLVDSAVPGLCDAEPARVGSRADISESGNRIASGVVAFTDSIELEVELPETALWVTADPSAAGSWYVVLESGAAVRVSPGGAISDAPSPPAVPPELDMIADPQSPFRFHELFPDPISDGRVVVADNIAAVLSTPTDFYRHGVLGDALEAAAIEWVDACSGETGRIDIAEPDVIEGVSPILADIDSDGQIEILVTLSNSDSGSRLAAFELDGTSAGESEPIGRGNRWRNQLAVGPFGPDGEIEIIDVRTPHIGGTVQAFRHTQDDGGNPSLVQVAASDDRYTSHVLGLRNLSMGIAVDADDDGLPDVLVATAQRDAIVALTRTTDSDGALDGWQVVGERPLANELTSNIGYQQRSPADDQGLGPAIVAVADGNILRIWGQ